MKNFFFDHTCLMPASDTKTRWRCECRHILQKKDQYLLSFTTVHFQDSGYEIEMLRRYLSANKSYIKQ